MDATVVSGGVDPRFAPARRPRGARLERPYVLCVASHTARKNLARSSRPRARSPRDGRRASSSPAATARSSRPRAGLDALRPARPRPDDVLPGLYAGAEAFVLPSRLRGLRPAGAGGDGLPARRSSAADVTALPETAAARRGSPTRTPRRSRRARDAARATRRERARLTALGLGAEPAGSPGSEPRSEVDAIVRAARGGDDAAQRRREAQQVQAWLRGRLGGGDALLRHDGVRGLYYAWVEAGARGVLELRRARRRGRAAGRRGRERRSRCPRPRRCGRRSG